MPGETDRAHGADQRDAAWALAMVVATTALTGFALSIMLVAFPAIRAAFPDASPAQLSWINNLFTIVSAAVIIPCGVLADRVGRKRMLLVGTALFAVGSVVGAIAPSPGWIMVGRTVLALGAASFGPAGMAMLVAVFPPRRVVFAVSIWAISGGVSSSLGPSLGGLLVDTLGWRWGFWMNLPLCALILAVGPFVLRESARDRATRLPDPLGVVLVILATSSVTLAVVQRKTDPGWGWAGRWTLLALAVGAVLAAAFVVRCRHTPNPLVRLELLRPTLVRLGTFGLTVQNIGFFAVYWAFVQHTVNQWDWSVAQAGLTTVPVSLLSGIVAFATGRAADRVGPGPFVVAGATGMLVANGYLWFAIGPEESVAAVVVGATIMGLTSGLPVPSLASLALRGIPREQHSFGSALNSMAQRIGATFGNALAITFVAAEVGTGALRHTIATASVAVLCTLPVGVWATRRAAPAAP